MDTGPTEMEIGNIEFRHRSRNSRFKEEEMEDIHQERCFVCEKKGCRARNHDEKKPSVR